MPSGKVSVAVGGSEIVEMGAGDATVAVVVVMVARAREYSLMMLSVACVLYVGCVIVCGVCGCITSYCFVVMFSL
jgi:hypothetical protein